jgi:hypothetical protein
MIETDYPPPVSAQCTYLLNEQKLKAGLYLRFCEAVLSLPLHTFLLSEQKLKAGLYLSICEAVLLTVLPLTLHNLLSEQKMKAGLTWVSVRLSSLCL